MSCPSPNEYISKKEDEESEDEDKIISKYILELKNEETRDEALKKLYYFNEKQREKIALYLWYSGGCMAVLLQELIKLYQYLPAVNLKKITTETYNKAVHILFFFQSLASNSQTKKELIESGMLVYAFPFLSIVPNSKYSFMIKVSVLSLLNTLVTKFDIETFNFLKQNQIIPIILKIILNGKEMDKSIALHILVIITSNVTGLEYLCDVKERIKATEVSLAKILLNDDSSKLKKMALKILLNLTENSEAKNMLKKDTLKIFNNFSFYKNLDENAKIKAKQLEKILQDCDTAPILSFAGILPSWTAMLSGLSFLMKHRISKTPAAKLLRLSGVSRRIPVSRSPALRWRTASASSGASLILFFRGIFPHIRFFSAAIRTA